MDWRWPSEPDLPGEQERSWPHPVASAVMLLLIAMVPYLVIGSSLGTAPSAPSLPTHTSTLALNLSGPIVTPTPFPTIYPTLPIWTEPLPTPDFSQLRPIDLPPLPEPERKDHAARLKVAYGLRNLAANRKAGVLTDVDRELFNLRLGELIPVSIQFESGQIALTTLAINALGGAVGTHFETHGAGFLQASVPLSRLADLEQIATIHAVRARLLVR